MRLVDKDSAMEIIKRRVEEGYEDKELLHYAEYIFDFYFPDDEVVEIVECKDCKHADEYFHCYFANWWTTKYDYCSRGVRKDDDILHRSDSGSDDRGYYHVPDSGQQRGRTETGDATRVYALPLVR